MIEATNAATSPTAHKLLLKRPKHRRFVVYEEFIGALPVSLSAKLTLAILMSLMNAGLRTRASDITPFTQLTTRSLRRLLVELERAGLIIRRARYRGGRRVDNEYELLWHPSMPEELKGPPHCVRVSVASDEDGRGREVKLVPVSEATVSALSGKREEKEEQQASRAEGDGLVPPSLVAQLTKLTPHHVRDSLRVVREAARDLPPDRARVFVVAALQRLIARCEQQLPSNPPGLLRACIVKDALADVSAVSEEERRLLAGLERIDSTLTGASCGFELIRRMRKRELSANEYRAHVLASKGEDVSSPPVVLDDPGLAVLVGDVQRLLQEVRTAREKGDALCVNRLDEELHRLERRLDSHLQDRRGNAS